MQMQHVRLFGFRRAGTLPALQGSHGPGTEVEPEGVKLRMTEKEVSDTQGIDVSSPQNNVVFLDSALFTIRL